MISNLGRNTLQTDVAFGAELFQPSPFAFSSIYGAKTLSDKQSELQSVPAAGPDNSEEPADGQNGASEEPRTLTPAAQRALAEAEARRKEAADAKAAGHEKELGGQRGPEPTRFGDWEKGGIISDF